VWCTNVMRQKFGSARRHKCSSVQWNCDELKQIDDKIISAKLKTNAPKQYIYKTMILTISYNCKM
jgi:hypothetical protein